MINGVSRKITAVIYGLLCHGIFFLAGLVMFLSIITGFSYSIGGFTGVFAIFINLALLVQFPIGHSFFLTAPGMKALDFFSPKPFAKTLRTTVYATIASLQLLFLFIFWSPSQIVIWEINFPIVLVVILLNLFCWLLLSISSIQAGYQLQTGSLGWSSLYYNKKPIFPKMPENGLFSIIRQPIYFSFCLVLWTSPKMTLDLLIIAVLYSIYCFLGPLFKEVRFKAFYGEKFMDYQKKVPYFFPKYESSLIKKNFLNFWNKRLVKNSNKGAKKY